MGNCGLVCEGESKNAGYAAQGGTENVGAEERFSPLPCALRVSLKRTLGN